MKKIIYIINVPLHISNHLFGVEHTETHRICVGIVVMCCGYFISKIDLFHYFFEITGYFIHGAGSLPAVDYIQKKVNYGK